jgi:hypothetical protein
MHADGKPTLQELSNVIFFGQPFKNLANSAAPSKVVMQ